MPIDFNICQFRIKQIDEEYKNRSEKIRSLNREQLENAIGSILWENYGINPNFKGAQTDDLLRFKLERDIYNPMERDMAVARCKCLSDAKIDIPEHIEKTAQLETYLNEQIRLYGKK